MFPLHKEWSNVLPIVSVISIYGVSGLMSFYNSVIMESDGLMCSSGLTTSVNHGIMASFYSQVDLPSDSTPLALGEFTILVMP